MSYPNSLQGGAGQLVLAEGSSGAARGRSFQDIHRNSPLFWLALNQDLHPLSLSFTILSFPAWLEVLLRATFVLSVPFALKQ